MYSCCSFDAGRKRATERKIIKYVPDNQKAHPNDDNIMFDFFFVDLVFFFGDLIEFHFSACKCIMIQRHLLRFLYVWHAFI